MCRQDLVGHYPVEFTGVNGTTVTAKQGSSTVTGTIGSSGKVVLWLPNDGQWVISSSKALTPPVQYLWIEISKSQSISGTHVPTRTSVNGLQPLYHAQSGHSSANINDKYVVIGMGHDGTNMWNDVSLYNTNMSRTQGTTCDILRKEAKGASIGKYGMICCGVNNGVKWEIDIWDDTCAHSLTKCTIGRQFPGAASTGKHVFLAGGFCSGQRNEVDAIDANLTLTVAPVLKNPSHGPGGAAINGFAIFCGGQSNVDNIVLSDAQAYDSSLTRIDLNDLHTPSQFMYGAASDHYAIFPTHSSNEHTWTAYDVNLSKFTVNNPLSGQFVIGTGYNEYVIFGGRSVWNVKNATVDVYDQNLTMTTTTDLSLARDWTVPVKLKDMLIFAGGWGPENPSDLVEVYR